LGSFANVTVRGIATRQTIATWAFAIAAASCPRAMFNDMDRFVVSFVCEFCLFFSHSHCRTYERSMLLVSIVNPDHFAVPWPRNPRIASIDLLYRTTNSRNWLQAVHEDRSKVTFPYSVNTVCYGIIYLDIVPLVQGGIGTGLASVTWRVPDAFVDGEYELAVRVTCKSSVSAPIPGKTLML
jgi:hypothetical protein